MNKRELKKFEKLLLEERARLLGSIKRIESESRDAGSREHSLDQADFADQGTDSFELETALNIASVESERITDIDEALQRIQEGTYGICEGSGEAIPKKRLEAFPSAKYTVQYQEKLEKEQSYYG